jgi:hypothetical protein
MGVVSQDDFWGKFFWWGWELLGFIWEDMDFLFSAKNFGGCGIKK